MKAVLDAYGNIQGRMPILIVCVTHWVENIEGWERFSLNHRLLVKMCEVIIYGDPQLQTYNDGWTADKKNSLVYLKTFGVIGVHFLFDYASAFTYRISEAVHCKK